MRREYDGHMTRPAPIPFDTHRFVKRLTDEGMPAGQAEALADEQISLLNSHLATKQDISHLATKEDVAATNKAVAVLKSDLRTLKWVIVGVGFGMLTVMVGVSSLVIQMFWTV